MRPRLISHADVPAATRLSEVSTTAAAEALNRCFEDYVVPFHLSAEAYARRFHAEGLDVFASRLVGSTAEPLALVLITRRAAWARVAAMAVASVARGGGLGRRLLALAVEEAVARGDRGMLLEVIEGNARAIRLYESMGFQTTRRLIGFRGAGAASAAGGADRLEGSDVVAVSRAMTTDGETRELPWPLRPETLAGLTGDVEAFSSAGGDAFAIVQNGRSDKPRLSCLFVAPEARGRGAGLRLLGRLTAGNDREWTAPPYLPEGRFEGFMAAAGWRVHETTQLEMKLTF
jgi:GNAT superfamily N-acetyltransferase